MITKTNLFCCLTTEFISVLAFATLAVADSVDDQAIARYKEIVTIANSDWVSTKGPVDLNRAARAAVTGGKDLGPISGGRAADQLEILVRAEAIRKGQRAYLIAEQAATEFVRSLDPWSSYMDPAAWRQYQKSMNPQFSGVGMDVEREISGYYTCWPYPGSAAEAAGITLGATLKAVDGRPVRGLSLYSIISQVRGPSGKAVQISFSSGLWTKTVPIIRRPMKAQTVFSYNGKSGPGIRISHFAGGTSGELAKALQQVRGAPLEIDLRDCRGGDLDVATACTGPFLPRGTLVATIRRKRGASEKLVSPGGQTVRSPSVRLLQNGNTASSAELFIQALTANGKAQSSGSVSTGKGTTQSVIDLSDGGAVILTTGLLLNPRTSVSWHGAGLRPTR